MLCSILCKGITILGARLKRFVWISSRKVRQRIYRLLSSLRHSSLRTRALVQRTQPPMAQTGSRQNLGMGKLHLLGPPSYSTNVELVPDEPTAPVAQNSAQHPRTNKRKRPFQSFVSGDSGSVTYILDEEEGRTLSTLDFDDDVIEMVGLQAGATREGAITALEENKGDAVLSILNLLRSRPE
jgi:NACalpha-BTF3-like transcription factor